MRSRRGGVNLEGGQPRECEALDGSLRSEAGGWGPGWMAHASLHRVLEGLERRLHESPPCLPSYMPSAQDRTRNSQSVFSKWVSAGPEFRQVEPENECFRVFLYRPISWKCAVKGSPSREWIVRGQTRSKERCSWGKTLKGLQKGW